MANFSIAGMPPAQDVGQQADAKQDGDGVELPPRVLVELPDGQYAIGEDSARLPPEPTYQHEDSSNSHLYSDAGTRRMLEINGLLSLMAHRRRALVVVIGVDLVYTTMTAASVLLSGDGDEEAITVGAQAGAGILIDILTFAFTLRIFTPGLRWSQLGQLVVFLASVILQFHPILLIRILILFILARLVAAATELERVTSDDARRVWWPSMHYILVGRGLGYSGPYTPEPQAPAAATNASASTAADHAMDAAVAGSAENIPSSASSAQFASRNDSFTQALGQNERAGVHTMYGRNVINAGPVAEAVIDMRRAGDGACNMVVVECSDA